MFCLLTVLLSQLMLTLAKTRFLSVSQTYGLCSALLDRSIRAGIFYGTTPPSTSASRAHYTGAQLIWGALPQSPLDNKGW